MHSDHKAYLRFTGRARLDKSINSLIGLIEGVTIDQHVNTREICFIKDWLSEHAELAACHPYNELMPVLTAALEDGILTMDERDDILWLCEKFRSTNYYDEVTADLQRLHAMLGAIISDGIITETELNGLSAWLAEHEHLRTCWPYDEIDSLILSVMNDRKIDEQEQVVLQTFFSEFISFMDDTTITTPLIKIGSAVTGLCAVCPEIIFDKTVFCFTGASTQYSRAAFTEIVRNLGGSVVNSISSKVDYLIIGAEGNPCWAYACYGRKVEQAVKLRKEGNRILLVHENDFHDAIADCI